jgi:hypothetical protein
MGDEILLFALLGLLYVVECCFLLHKHSVAFRERAGGRCSISFPSSNSGSRDRAFHLYPLFPPLRPVYFSHILPVSMSDRGILAYVSQTLTETGRPKQSGSVLEFGEIRSVRAEEEDLILNENRFVRCRNPEQAAFIAETVEEIVRPSGKKTCDILHEVVHSTLDPEQVKRIVSEYRIQSDNLRILCNSVFILLFLFFPVISIWKGLAFSLLATLALLVVMIPFLCYFFYSLHRLYFPERKGTRISSLFRFILWPLSAIRANDCIVHSILSRYHPASVALALCSKSDAAEFLRKILRDLRHPLYPDVDGELARSIDNDWRTRMVRRVEGTARRMGIEERELEEIPPTTDPSMIAYCPRCLAQFSSALAACPDCLGVSPVLFQLLQKNIGI